MLYNFATWVVRGFYRLIFKIEIEGLDNIPKDKTYVVIANHKSNFDPPLIAAFLPFKMGFMAKESLFRVFLVGTIIKKFGAFPVKAGGHNISAIKTAVEILKNGRNLLIFPEGKRVFEKGKLEKGKKGAALIASKAGVGLLPIGICGEYGFRAKIKLNIGELIEFDNTNMTSDELERITNQVAMVRISELCGDKIYEDCCC